MTKFDYLHYDPWPPAQTLLEALERSTLITLAVIGKLSNGQELVALSPNLNPPHWEFGHLIWFHEFWVHRQGIPSNPSFLSDSDTLFNSSEIFHDDRWQAKLPSINVLKSYFSDVVERSYAILQSGSLTPEQAYFMQLALFHQDMHNEAFAYMWQSLAYEWPIEQCLGSIPEQKDHLDPYYLNFPESQLQLGSGLNTGFIFDNEKWQHEVVVPLFSISSHAVNNGQYLEFLEAHPLVSSPSHWKQQEGQWYERSFHRWLVMDLQAPVRHISALEAERYCDWRGLRLPSEKELAVLMQSSPIGWRHSCLWEWTSSVFVPFEGFTPDPYRDYSAPWFDGKHRVLKGWSVYTPAYLRRPQFRNFYLPSRSDPFCGFRTCLP